EAWNILMINESRTGVTVEQSLRLEHNENKIEEVNLPIDKAITLPIEDNLALARIKRDLSVNPCEGTFILLFIFDKNNIQVFKDVVKRID
ncbi:5372_t:CDS:1, partial [Dentiscutata heterogama]